MGVTFSIPPSLRANTSLRFSIKLTSPSPLAVRIVDLARCRRGGLG